MLSHRNASRTGLRLMWLPILAVTCILSCSKQSSSPANQQEGVVSNDATQTLVIHPDGVKLLTGQRLQLSAQLEGGLQESLDVTTHSLWSSSNTSVATVDRNGEITAKGAGSCKVHALYEDQTAVVDVDVSIEVPVRLEIQPVDAVMYQGERIPYRVTGFINDYRAVDLTSQAAFRTSDQGVVRMGARGVATPVSQGTAEIEVKDAVSELVAKTRVTVKDAYIQSLNISPARHTLGSDGKRSLTAKATFSDGVVRDVSPMSNWSSANEGVGRVNYLGEVTGEAAGETVITATFGALSASAVIEVKEYKTTGLLLKPENIRVPKGFNRQLTLKARYENGLEEDMTHAASWTVDQPGVAEVRQNGVIKGVAAGETALTVDAKGLSLSAKIIVDDAVLSRAALVPQGSAGEFLAGESYRLSVQGQFSNGESMDITSAMTFRSLQPAVLNVVALGEQAGEVTAIREGLATIQAACPSCGKTVVAHDSYSVKAVSLQQLTVEPAQSEIPLNHEMPLAAMGRFSDGKTRNLSEQANWSSDKPDIITVSPDGIIKSLSEGLALISAEYAGHRSVAGVYVVADSGVRDISITPDQAVVKPRSALFFKATALLNNGAVMDVTGQGKWKSSKPVIVAIGNNNLWKSGRAWAWGATGTCEISFTYEGITKKTTLTVKRL